MLGIFGEKNLVEPELQMEFYKQKLLIILETKKNLFEISSIFKPINLVENCRFLINEIGIVFDIIDELKLNQKIGL